jgi:putative endonuclease
MNLMYVVYAIYNETADKYYIGQTKDLEVRLNLHNTKTFRGYTSRFDGLWKVIYSEEVSTRSEALLREKQLKSYQGRQFIKKYIPR